jgi:hypothetical protein
VGAPLFRGHINPYGQFALADLARGFATPGAYRKYSWPVEGVGPPHKPAKTWQRLSVHHFGKRRRARFLMIYATAAAYVSGELGGIGA